ncbi:MFS transporter-like protein [Amylocarpus encephaloides]|uniref:MFS transporter-like protein n=1 Tax=Amylocarpus encephaloides TaxID=45428 RepID=A0A9P8C722_9HELO|nr:MFS transporter-like protein [Amylocarpus encephaloides]
MFTKAGLYTFIYGERVENAEAPPFLKFRSSKAFITATIAIAVFTDIFLYSVVVPVLPFALTERANVNETDVQKWTSVFLSVYGAALAVGSPIFGWFADRSSSRRAPLLLGLLALGGSTGMLAGGRSLSLLVVGRFCQGLSAAVVWTVGLALLSDTIEKENIGQAMGYIAAATSIGSLLGPLLGGIVYDHAGYYATFAMGFAIIGFDICLRLLMIEKSVAAQWSQSPGNEISESTQSSDNSDRISDGPQIDDRVTKEKANESSPSTPTTPTNWSHRLPPVITLLRIPRLLAALIGCFVASNSLGSFDSVLPLYVKETFSWNSSGAGLIFICLVIPALLGPVIGMASDRYGTRALTTIGLLASVPCWVLLRLVTSNTIRQKVLLCALLALLGLFLTMILAPLMAEIDHCLTMEERRRPGSLGEKGAAAQGFGLFNLAYAIGSLVGPLWAGLIVEKAGWGTMTWTLGLLSGIAAVPVFWWTGGRIMLRGRDRAAGASAVV